MKGEKTMLNFYQHSTCTSCRKGRQWLEDHSIEYHVIDMIATPPSKEQLMEWMTAADLPISRFFDGMLIKRPLVTDGKKITLGFKEEDFEKEWVK